MFICGSRNFQHLEAENEPCSSPCRTPKRSKISNFFKTKDKNKVNPYAEVGLDRFKQLVAEHESRRQQIYAELGSENISMVRFVYSSDSNVMKPIVVRTMDKSKRTDDSPRCSSSLSSNDQHVIQKSAELSVHVPAEQEEDLAGKKKKKRSLRTCRLDNLGRRFYYFLAILAFILFLLAISSRVFAISCMTIIWYMVPTAVPESQSRRNPKRKKEVNSSRFSSPKTGVAAFPSGCLSEDTVQHVRRRRSW